MSLISLKANRILNLILIAFLLILIRVWHLTIVQHEYYLEKARKPQRRFSVERVERGTICDRFNIPLALNKIQYNVAVSYAPLSDPSSLRAKKISRREYIQSFAQFLGKALQLDPLQLEDLIYGKAALFPHTPFVIKEALSEKEYYRLKMAEKDWPGLKMQISSRRYYPQGKTGSDIIGYMGAISQKEYTDLAGKIHELHSYLQSREQKELAFLPKGFTSPLEVRKRLKELQEKAYTINDLIGKSGIEKAFDEKLRGTYGKKIYEVDMRGSFIRELPGSYKGTPAERIRLSLSQELQEFADKLLAHNEHYRETSYHKENQEGHAPWIKGGAIVALIPHTGEIVACSSYPRFDPNDFIPSKNPSRIKTSPTRWLENEAHLSDLWNGKAALQKELYSLSNEAFYEEGVLLTWERYLDMSLSPKSSVRKALEKIGSLQTAVFLQRNVEAFLKASGQSDMHALIDVLYQGEGHIATPYTPPLATQEIIRARLVYAIPQLQKVRKELDFYLASIPHNLDKILLLDLCRLIAPQEEFSGELLGQVGQHSFADSRSLSQALSPLQDLIRYHVRLLHKEHVLRPWRKTAFKAFLKEKRKQERERKLPLRPYTDYLEQKEKELFEEFWQKSRSDLLYHVIFGPLPQNTPSQEELLFYFSSLEPLRKNLSHYPPLQHLHKALAPLSLANKRDYLKVLRSFEELSRPLWGSYPRLRKREGPQLEKDLAAAFYPVGGFGYNRSQAYRQATAQGSVFKLITAYTALYERYQYLVSHNLPLTDLNPLTLIDDLHRSSSPSSHQQILGYTMDGKPIPRLYKGGLLPRSHPHIGKIDLIGALEQSSNLYFPLLTTDVLADPRQLTQAARLFGLGERSGVALPGEIPGFVPTDITHNRTGLYALSIGQHSLVVTPLQTAMMLATIANQGSLLKPQIIHSFLGGSLTENHPFTVSHYPYQDELALIDIYFPLFTQLHSPSRKKAVASFTPEVRRSLPMPPPVRSYLLQGMERVVRGERGTARASTIQMLQEYPSFKKDYLHLQHEIIGKTGTAQILHAPFIDAESSPEMHTHIWFAGISFNSKEPLPLSKQEPELIVVVYLRFGTAGKEAAPLAVEMVKKWRELSAKYASQKSPLKEKTLSATVSGKL